MVMQSVEIEKVKKLAQKVANGLQRQNDTTVGETGSRGLTSAVDSQDLERKQNARKGGKNYMRNKPNER